MLDFKTLNVFRHMNELILRQQTGSAEEFAGKLGKSRSALFIYLKCMRNMGAPIEYCPYKRSYYYKEHGSFKIGFTED